LCVVIKKKVCNYSLTVNESKKIIDNIVKKCLMVI
jgi:hypothetical protein